MKTSESTHVRNSAHSQGDSDMPQRLVTICYRDLHKGHPGKKTNLCVVLSISLSDYIMTAIAQN